MLSSQVKQFIKIEYFLVYFLLATTGVPFFYSNQEYIVLGLIISFVVFVIKSKKYRISQLWLIGLIFIIEVFQIVLFAHFSPITFLGTYSRLLFAFLIVGITRINFLSYYYKIIYFHSILSLVFYIPSIIFPSFYSYMISNICPYFNPIFSNEGFYQTSPNIIVYTFGESLFDSFRNSGPFWEPGAFGMFILLALLFSILSKEQLFCKKNVFLIIVLLTTFSTTAYLGLFYLILTYKLIKYRNRLTLGRIAGIILIIASAIFLYNSLEFLKQKVETNINLSEETTSSRFGSALADYHDFIQNPIIGYGRTIHRHGGESESDFNIEKHRNNGLTDLLVTYGIIVFIAYFISYYYSFKNICIKNAIPMRFASVGLGLFLLLGFSQGIFLRPFFFALLFFSKPVLK